MDKERYHLDLQRGEQQFCLWRLTDEEYKQLRSNSLPIKEDGLFLIQLMLFERHRLDRLTLPKAFVTLEHLFGSTSDLFDDWKGSFSFPLLLVVQKPAGQFFYLLQTYDLRGSLQFSLYRVLENGTAEYDINRIQEPFELEFSREEINEFISYFYGYLIGAAEIACMLLRQPFMNRIDSNHILYGYRNEVFFEEQIDSEEDYKAAIQAFEETYRTAVENEQAVKVRVLLQQITGKRREH